MAVNAASGDSDNFCGQIPAIGVSLSDLAAIGQQVMCFNVMTVATIE